MQPGLEDLFRRNYPVIVGRCARLLGDREEANDVAQETFLRLAASAMGDAAPAVRARWIYRTSSRLAIDKLRRRRLGVEVAGDVDAAGGEARADDVVAARRWLAVIAAVVPRRELEVAIFSRVDRMSHPEIAEVTGLSSRTVERLLERFAARLERLKARAR